MLSCPAVANVCVLKDGKQMVLHLQLWDKQWRLLDTVLKLLEMDPASSSVGLKKNNLECTLTHNVTNSIHVLFCYCWLCADGGRSFWTPHRKLKKIIGASCQPVRSSIPIFAQSPSETLSSRKISFNQKAFLHHFTHPLIPYKSSLGKCFFWPSIKDRKQKTTVSHFPPVTHPLKHRSSVCPENRLSGWRKTSF